MKLRRRELDFTIPNLLIRYEHSDEWLCVDCNYLFSSSKCLSDGEACVYKYCPQCGTKWNAIGICDPRFWDDWEARHPNAACVPYYVGQWWIKERGLANYIISHRGTDDMSSAEIAEKWHLSKKFSLLDDTKPEDKKTEEEARAWMECTDREWDDDPWA